MTSPVSRPDSAGTWQAQPAGPSAPAAPASSQRASDAAFAPRAPTAGSALAAPRQAGTLGGIAVDPASMSNFQRMMAQARPSARPAWDAALAALREGTLQSKRTPAPGQPWQFGTTAHMPDGRPVTMGVVARPGVDGRMEMSHVALRDNITQHAVQYRLTSEAEDVAATLERLSQGAMAHGPGSARAYRDTAALLDNWMSRSGRGRVLDVRGDTAALLRDFQAHVGPNSYPGRNAEVVLRALAGGPVDRPQEATDDPLGLDAPTHAQIGQHPNGRAIELLLQRHAMPLLQTFSQTQIAALAVAPRAEPVLDYLRIHAHELADAPPLGLGLPAAGLVDVGRSANGPSGLMGIKETGAGLMAAPSGGLGMAPSDLLQIAARRYGGHDLEILEQWRIGQAEPEGPRLPADAVIGLAFNPSGIHWLEKASEHWQLLTGPAPDGLGFSAQQLLDLEPRRGSAVTLQALSEVGRNLMRTMGLRTSDLLEIADQGDAGPKLKKLHESGPALQAAGLPTDALVEVASHRCCLAVLRELDALRPALQANRIEVDTVLQALQPLVNGARRLRKLPR